MFLGFTVADFDCYEPRKWKSNVFNRERLEVKQKLTNVARLVIDSLKDAEGESLWMEVSGEHPALWNFKQVEAQHVYFSRNEAARKELDKIMNRQRSMSSLLEDPTPQKNHVFLCLSLNYDSLEVALKLHPDASVDRQNIEKKIEDHFMAEKLLDLLQQLPSFSIGMTPDKKTILDQESGHLLTLDEFRGFIKQLTALGSDQAHTPMSLTQGPRFFSISTSMPRATVLELVEQNAGDQLISFVRENLQKLLPLYHFIAWSRRNDYVSVKQVLDQEKVSNRQKGLTKNDSIRIIKGLWSGKRGIIQEIDSKGQLKILIGKMAVKVDATEVEKIASSNKIL